MKAKNKVRLNHSNYLVFLFLIMLSITRHTPAEDFILPDLASMIRLALSQGDIEAIVGQRHFTGSPVIGWEQHSFPKTPIYHNYGFGGSGLTLAPAVAEYVSSQVGEKVIEQTGHGSAVEVIVFGAGYLGVFTALEVKHFLDRNSCKNASVKVISQAYPKGISNIDSSKQEPVRKDNYSSMTAGGWVMPVSIEPLDDHHLWCKLVKRSQALWQSYAETAPLNTATRITKSLVFYDKLYNSTDMEDKSGIKAINQSCSFNLYPETQSDNTFYSLGYSDQKQTPRHFEQVINFSNVIQTDTVSVLKFMTQQLIDKKVTLIQTKSQIESYDELSHYFDKSRQTFIINASGHGAHNIFGHKPSSPIRGDLVLLKIPVRHITDHIKKVSHYSFWAGGTNYVFLRYSLDGQWLEVVLGGTFIKADDSLTTRPETVLRITRFWLDFFHQPPVSQQARLEKEELVKKVLAKALRD